MTLIFEPGRFGADGTLANGEAVYFEIGSVAGQWQATAYVENRGYTIAAATVDGAMLACRLACREGFAAWAAGASDDGRRCDNCGAAIPMGDWQSRACGLCPRCDLDTKRGCDDCGAPIGATARGNLCHGCYIFPDPPVGTKTATAKIVWSLHPDTDRWIVGCQIVDGPHAGARFELAKLSKPSPYEMGDHVRVRFCPDGPDATVLGPA